MGQAFGDELSGGQAALQFSTGYLIEKSFNLYNLFVIALNFAYFRIPAKPEHRILFWGILGALVTTGGGRWFARGGVRLSARRLWLGKEPVTASLRQSWAIRRAQAFRLISADSRSGAGHCPFLTRLPESPPQAATQPGDCRDHQEHQVCRGYYEPSYPITCRSGNSG